MSIAGAEPKLEKENKMLKFLKSKLRIFDEREAAFFQFYKNLLEQTEYLALEK